MSEDIYQLKTLFFRCGFQILNAFFGAFIIRGLLRSRHSLSSIFQDLTDRHSRGTYYLPENSWIAKRAGFLVV
jgi:hypothetical protein